MADKSYDAIVIGAGHNGLTCAGYLARAGLTVKVVEARDKVGGAAVTEEFHPGFRNSVFSYVVSLLNPKVIRDLELHKHGLQIIDRTGGSFSALDVDNYLWMCRDQERAKNELAKYSKEDAAVWDEFDARLVEIAELLRDVALETPPNIGGGWGDLWTLLGVANKSRKLSPQQQATLIELMTMSIGDYLDKWFEGTAIKGELGFEGVIGNFVSPYQAGSAYVLLHHVFGEVNGKTGAWGHAKGGMGAITQAMAKSADSVGVDIEVNAPVKQVLTEKGKAVGVELADGRVIRAKLVSSNLNPKLLFTQLVDDGLLPREFNRRMRSWRSQSGTFRMNVALSELPKFPTLAGEENPAQFLNGTVNVCPSLDYIQNAYDDARKVGWAQKPVISMCIPSTIDDTLAPEGCHVASMFCQHFNPDLPDGKNWDDVKEDVADLIIDTMNERAPNFKASVVGRQINSPLDIERKLGMLGGDIFHGALHLDQLYSMRPAPGYADYRSPISGLYMCGSGTHPGGGVSGLPGHNAAREILKDVKRRRV